MILAQKCPEQYLPQRREKSFYERTKKEGYPVSLCQLKLGSEKLVIMIVHACGRFTGFRRYQVALQGVNEGRRRSTDPLTTRASVPTALASVLVGSLVHRSLEQ